MSLPPLGRRMLRLRDRIDLSSPRDVFHWTATWGMSDQELRDAVAAAGSKVIDVAAYLGQPVEGEEYPDGNAD